MNKVEAILSNLTDLAKSSLPVLDCVSFGLSTGLSCALAYYERQGQRNLEMFVKSLDERLKDLELETEKKGMYSLTSKPGKEAIHGRS